MRYVCVDGDMIDAVCYRYYGRHGMVPTVVEANPGLESLGPRLSHGVVIELPNAPPPSAPTPRRLWD